MAGFYEKSATTISNELLHKTVVLELIKQEEMEYLAKIDAGVVANRDCEKKLSF